MPEAKGPFSTLTVLGLVKYDKECLVPYLKKQEADRDKAIADAKIEADRIAKEEEQARIDA